MVSIFWLNLCSCLSIKLSSDFCKKYFCLLEFCLLVCLFVWTLQLERFGAIVLRMWIGDKIIWTIYQLSVTPTLFLNSFFNRINNYPCSGIYLQVLKNKIYGTSQLFKFEPYLQQGFWISWISWHSKNCIKWNSCNWDCSNLHIWRKFKQ